MALCIVTVVLQVRYLAAACPAEIWLNSIRYAMIDQLRRPRPGFEEATRAHFRLLRWRIMRQCGAWLEQARALDPLFQVGWPGVGWERLVWAWVVVVVVWWRRGAHGWALRGEARGAAACKSVRSAARGCTQHRWLLCFLQKRLHDAVVELHGLLAAL